MNKYAKAPFTADFLGGYIFNADGFMFAQVRGWGELQHKEKDPEAAQDANLQFMVDALNEKARRGGR